MLIAFMFIRDCKCAKHSEEKEKKRRRRRTTKERLLLISHICWTNKAKCNTSASKLSHKEMGKKIPRWSRSLCSNLDSFRTCVCLSVGCWVFVSVHEHLFNFFLGADVTYVEYICTSTCLYSGCGVCAAKRQREFVTSIMHKAITLFSAFYTFCLQ